MSNEGDFDNITIDRMEWAKVRSELRETSDLAEIRLRVLQSKESELNSLRREYDIYRRGMEHAMSFIKTSIAVVANGSGWTHRERDAIAKMLLEFIGSLRTQAGAEYIEDVNDIPF